MDQAKLGRILTKMEEQGMPQMIISDPPDHLLLNREMDSSRRENVSSLSEC